MLRGINRQDIFEEPEDYWTFIKILSAVQERVEDDLVTKTKTCHIYAYFQLNSKERQKDIVRDVMTELGAGPRQMSRVTGLSYSFIYKLNK